VLDRAQRVEHEWSNQISEPHETVTPLNTQNPKATEPYCEARGKRWFVGEGDLDLDDESKHT